MKYFVAAIGYKDRACKEVNEIRIVTFPWSGIHLVKADKFKEFKDKLENFEIYNDTNIVCTCGDRYKYTAFISDTEVIIRDSYTVLAKAKSCDKDIYFVTDGFKKPTWLNIDELIESIADDGYKLSNTRLEFNKNTGNKLVMLGDKNFNEVNYVEAQMEYRKFIKSLRRKQDENKN